MRRSRPWTCDQALAACHPSKPPNLQKGPILRLQNLLKSARSAVSCVERACEQIRCSDRLAHVLSRVLATGNVLNADTHRGNALAIKLDSLSKMSDVKVSPDIGLNRAQ